VPCESPAKNKGPKPSEFADAGLVPQCAVRAAGDRRLDQRLIHLTAMANRTPHRIDLDMPSTRSAATCRSWSISSRRAITIWSTSTCRRRAEADGAARRSHRSRCLTVTGETLREIVANAEDVPGQDVIRRATIRSSRKAAWRCSRQSRAARRDHQAGRGVAEAALQHTGRAVVFESVEDMANRVDDPDLDVTADDVLVLRNAGPKGAPGMPEAGYLPIPKKLGAPGVKDMVRISDARMSGTAFGTIVLQPGSPENHRAGSVALDRPPAGLSQQLDRALGIARDVTTGRRHRLYGGEIIGKAQARDELGQHRAPALAAGDDRKAAAICSAACRQAASAMPITGTVASSFSAIRPGSPKQAR
jgi:dihydroxy-acid dehydratase